MLPGQAYAARRSHRLRRDAVDGLAELPRQPRHEVPDERRQVLAPIGQRRDPDVTRGQAPEQRIRRAFGRRRAAATRCHALKRADLHRGGGDDPHVGRDALIGRRSPIVIVEPLDDRLVEFRRQLVDGLEE